MLDSKLLAMFRTLSTSEVNKFGLYVRSPYYNKSEKLVLLFDLVRSYHPNYDSPELVKEVVFKRLFPEKKAIDSSLRALMSGLTKLIEDYLILLEFEDTDNLRNELLLNSLKNRRLNSIFEKKLKSTSNALKKVKTKDTSHFQFQLELSSIAFEYIIVNANFSFESGLQDLLNNLDLYYVASKLRFTAASINRQNIIDKQYELNFLEEILEFVEESAFLEIPFIEFYYHLCKLLLEDNDEMHYTKLKYLIKVNASRISNDEVRQIYVVLANYCAKKLKKGQVEYLNEVFMLYKSMLEEDVLIMDKYMSTNNYFNISIVGSRLKQFEWTKNFIESYKKKINPEVREDAYSYGMAYLQFHLENYDKAKEYLMSVNLTDPYYYLLHKTLLIKTFYESKELESLNATLEAFRIYMLRDKSISEYNSKACQNFINILKKIVRIKQGGSRSPEVIIEDIKKTEPIIEQPWLEEITNQLL